MALEIIPVEKKTMFPLTGNVAEMPVAASSVGRVIASKFPVALARNIRVRADFVPSAELAAKIAGAIPAKVIDPADGTLLAEVEAGEQITLYPDEKSVRIIYPWDLLKLNEYIVGDLKQSNICGKISSRAEINGFINLGAGSVILPGVYIEGNVVIGENCKIGPNCYIRGNTSIGNSCHIGQAVEIKNSLLADKVAIGHLSYAGDSIIECGVNFGAGTIISNFRHDGKNHLFSVEGKLLDTGRRKFGAIIGRNVHTGIHTSIYPGRYLAADTSTLPGEVVKYPKM